MNPAPPVMRNRNGVAPPWWNGPAIMFGHRWRARSQYADALVHMRPGQLAHRLRRLVPVRVLAVRTESTMSQGWRRVALGLGVEAAPSSGEQPPPHLDGVYRAVGAERTWGAADYWTDSRDGLLFLFHLHGFAELARYASGPPSESGDRYWEAVIADWLGAFDRPALPAWHPYPMSGRIVAWCAALSREHCLAALRPALLRSLSRQARVLQRSVEHDIGGNHVLRNATALVVAGVCLEDAGHTRRGLRLLERQLAAQILADGGHEERSPSYHRLVLGDLLDVRTAMLRAEAPSPPWLDHAIEDMDRWLRRIAGPSGDVPPLNDGWDGPPLPQPASESLAHLADSGYVVLRDGDTQAILDAGPLAPPHLPAHAHADALSITMWAEAEPLIVDCGSGAYAGPDRARFRSTAAHNTVQVDGKDQCELWGPFRAAFMPRVESASIQRLENAVVVRSSHDGYRRLDDPVIHQRTLVWLGRDGAVVVDRLLSAKPHDVRSRLHFAETVERPFEALPGGLVLNPLPLDATVTTVAGARSPYLGRTLPIAVAETAGRVEPGRPFGWTIARPEVEVRVDGAAVVIQPAAGPPLRLGPD
jgi:hypothetical protein